MSSPFRSARRLAGFVGLLMAGSLLTGCSSADGPGTSDDGDAVIRVVSYPGQVNLSELADALGYLPDVELESVGNITGGPAAFQALASNQVDLANGFNGTLMSMVASGVPIKGVIANMGSFEDTYAAFVVPEGSEIRGARDLIGKKVAVNTLGAQAEAVVDTWLSNGGLTDKEIASITLVPLPTINSESALREGQVDVAFLQNFPLQVAMDHGGLRELITDIEVVGRPYNIGSYAFRNQFLEENPELAKGIVEALAKASDFARENSTEKVIEVYGTYLADHGRGDEIESLQTYTGTGIATQAGTLQKEDYTVWLNWLESSGDVKAGSINPLDAFTNDFNPLAKDLTR